jgi:hypothetical protein
VKKKQYTKVVFAAMSKKTFYLREHIIKFVLQQKATPTCAFMMFSYFLLDTVNRKALIDANNELIRRSDELLVFGDISDGVVEEIKLAKEIELPIKYFLCDLKNCSFKRIKEVDAEIEK